MFLIIIGNSVFKLSTQSPSSCASRAATRWQRLSPSCSAVLSLPCSSAAFCWWAEASSCSWDTRAAAEARSSVRRTWGSWSRGERWEGKMYWWRYIKIKATEMVERHRNKPGWVSAGASSVSLWKENGECWLMKRKQKDKKRNKVSWGASEGWWKRVIQWLQSDWDQIGASHSSLC